MTKEKKKGTCHVVNFVIPLDHRVKINESEKSYKLLELAWELGKLGNMRVTVIQILIAMLQMVSKDSENGLEELDIRRQFKIIKTTALLASTRILRRVLDTWGDLLSLRLQWKTIS